WGFELVGGRIDFWSRLLTGGLVALLIDWSANTLLVMVPTAVSEGTSVRRVVARVYAESPVASIASYLGLGFMAILVAIVQDDAGIPGVIAFLIPVLLTREAFAPGKALRELAARLQEKDRALLESTKSAVAERRDERLLVAGDLHDEVLPPLFQVHL